MLILLQIALLLVQIIPTLAFLLSNTEFSNTKGGLYTSDQELGRIILLVTALGHN
jgi:hypothetical protein